MPSELQKAIAGAIPNCDAFTDPDDARIQRAEFKHVSQVFKELATYCEAKAEAMGHRKAGRINVAMELEAYAETLFNNLPSWAKW